MKRSEIREKMDLFLRYLREEQELRDQAASLSFMGPEKEVRETIRQESEIMKKLEALRQEKMLPIVEELAKFVSVEMAGKGGKGKSAPPAAKAPAKASAPARR